MEQEELINEKNRLFERLKSEQIQTPAKKWIGGLLFFGLATIFLLVVLFTEGPTINLLGSIVLYFACIVAAVHNIIKQKKISKTDNPQDFLTVYDQSMKVDKWVKIVLVILLVIYAVFEFLQGHTFLVICALGICVAFYLFRIASKQRKADIERLRELVRQS